ncbi:hypothetical protein FS749_011970 [Ceratobasidium sp. UAMH 11750]|nr:hypothetical protein FS749_011970 [Ceratobasidium sp. UAMH 11750]
MEQLIEEGSMTGGRPLTKKIYIAFPVRLRYADPNPKSLAKGKRRAKSIDSLDENESGVDVSDNETDFGNAKRQKFGSPNSESETEAAHHETTSLPPLVDATPSVSASLSATALDALASQFPQPSPPSPTPTDIEVDHQVEHASASFSALLRISDPPSKDDITKDWLESKDTDNLSGPEEFLNSQRRYGGASCGSGSNPFQEGYSLDI